MSDIKLFHVNCSEAVELSGTFAVLEKNLQTVSVTVKNSLINLHLVCMTNQSGDVYVRQTD